MLYLVYEFCSKGYIVCRAAVVKHYFKAKILKLIILSVYLFLLILQSGDIEKNPGPSQNNICHWNMNGITTHNYIKLSLLQAYNAIKNYEFICLSETFLDGSNENYENLSINGYDMFRCNSPKNSMFLLTLMIHYLKGRK